MKKIIFILATILLLASAVYYYTFVYAKNHHRDAQKETAIIISSDAITAAYQNNEQDANKLYLNKAIEVSGKILTISKDQAGHTTLLIGKENAFSNVSVTLSSSETISKKIGDSVTAKGVCTGYLSDVIINEGALK